MFCCTISSGLSVPVCSLARVEDNVAHQNLMIRKSQNVITEANHTPALKERTMPLHFQDLHQLIRSAAMRADELHIPLSSALLMPTEQKVLRRMPDALLV